MNDTLNRVWMAGDDVVPLAVPVVRVDEVGPVEIMPVLDAPLAEERR